MKELKFCTYLVSWYTVLCNASGVEILDGAFLSASLIPSLSESICVIVGAVNSLRTPEG